MVLDSFMDSLFHVIKENIINIKLEQGHIVLWFNTLLKPSVRLYWRFISHLFWDNVFASRHTWFKRKEDYELQLSMENKDMV